MDLDAAAARIRLLSVGPILRPAMLLFAHRGYHAQAPENTLGAFAAAQDFGVDGIETDVRLSKDGLPVIMHDRVTPRGRAVAEITRRELEADVGHPVPILPDILDAFADVIWNVEIKTPDAWPATARVLAQFQHSRQLLVTSFRHDVVRSCADEFAIDCGLLIAHRPLDVGALIAACASRPRIKLVVWDYNVIDAAILDSVSSSGWGNSVYGAVTPAEHRVCMELGLAGLITDHPSLVREARA